MIRSDGTLTASVEADLERRLRALPLAPGPDPRFRSELRTQLLAAVERGPMNDSFAPAPARRTVRPRPQFAPAPRRRVADVLGAFLRPGRRTLGVLSGAMAVLLIIVGTTYWMAQRALPGDALYGLKRAGESVDLSIKGGDISRGTAYLSISSTRIDEASDLVKRDNSAADPGVVTHGIGISASADPDPARGRTRPRGPPRCRQRGEDRHPPAHHRQRQRPGHEAGHVGVDVAGASNDPRSKVSSCVCPKPAPGTAGAAARNLRQT